MLMNCTNSFRCWECDVDCLTKQLFLLPEPAFMAILHNSYAPNIGYMMTNSLSVKEAEEIHNIKTMSIIVARKKYLEKHS